MEMEIELCNGSYENLEFDEGCDINVALSDKIESFPLHWHTAAEIIMPLAGSTVVEINGKPYPLNTNDLLFISIGELHEIKNSSEGSVMILQFDFSLINNRSDFNACVSILQHIKMLTENKNSEIHKKIVNLMHDIKDEYISNQEFINSIMYSKLLQIYVLIARRYINVTDLFTDVTINRQQEYIIKFTEVFSYINNNFTQNLTLDELADFAGFSKFHFSRLFKQFTNMPLYDYINQKRISAAELLLLNPNLSITEVSMQSGFNSLSSFNRVFKSLKNCTPTQYKKLYSSH